MRRFPMRSKFYFSQWKTCFSWFIAKFLRFVVISHSLCYIWNVKRLILCKLRILCSTVKLKLGYSFPNSSIDVKLGFLSVDLIQTGKVGHWIRAYSSLAWADYSTVSPTCSSILFLSSLAGIINKLPWNNVSINLCLLVQV